eukprot:TRINITY_DN8589_c0_g1_i1.p1 TRINITY_DN8589_c0_g1~~TRINITY_DN8589_c0_g1_i1.p1  ORF type:complete len:130 (+),score=13.35 TRINITY_DN8589_c0_g1_i1:51-440(+)
MSISPWGRSKKNLDRRLGPILRERKWNEKVLKLCVICTHLKPQYFTSDGKREIETTTKELVFSIFRKGAQAQSWKKQAGEEAGMTTEEEKAERDKYRWWMNKASRPPLTLPNGGKETISNFFMEVRKRR